MRWFDRSILPRPYLRRRGSFLFEAVISLGLLAATATAVASLAGRLVREHQSQMQRMTVRFAAENVVERLRTAEYDELPDMVETLRTPPPAAEGPSENESMAVAIEVQPMSVSGIEGQHVVVTVIGPRQRSGRRMTTVQELWRFDDNRPDAVTTAEEAGEGATTSTEESQ